MNPIKKVVDIIENNDFLFLKKYISIYIFSVLVLLSIIQFFFIWQRSLIRQNVENMRQKKHNITSLINKKIALSGLKKSTDEILKREDHFRLKDYVYSLLSKNNMLKYVTSQNEVITEQKFKNNYLEYSMQIEFSNLSTQEGLEILAILENDIRVYFKNILIKNLHNKKISLQCVISTIKLI